LLVRLDEMRKACGLSAGCSTTAAGPILSERPAARARRRRRWSKRSVATSSVSVRLEGDGCLGHVHARDASWFQWPLLEAAIEGNIVADFPLCNKSFNCSYSGHDL
jgi:Ni,Fe-hydrogenase III large subunit